MRFFTFLIFTITLIVIQQNKLKGSETAERLTIQGLVYDNENKEPLTGATIILKGTQNYGIAGLDGTFKINNILPGEYKIIVSFISYDTHTETINIIENKTLSIGLNTATISLGGVEVRAQRVLSTEANARATERLAINTVNAISSSAIELSPDLTVANVVQRVSGLTVERGNSGEAQYAIVRGMDKRYNYTLVNGIKIPSPDNENRYVPLDIFPADLLDQLVVSKSLTPSMEGDAIGGVVDMIMKSAHSERMFSASVSTGYNEVFLNRSYDYFNHNAVDRTPPMQRVPEGSRVATREYYSSENFNFKEITPRPNILGSVSIGGRLLDNKLGIIIAGTYQNTNRGTNRTQFGISETNRGANNMPRVSRYQERRYSINQERAGLHNKIDYDFNRNHSISLYNVLLHLQTNETRIIWEDELRSLQHPTLENNFRGQINIQRIYNSTLQGKHRFSPVLNADWSLAYAFASQNVPDNSQLITVSNYDTPGNELRWLIHENNIRIWEKNTDQDYSIYYNLSYTPDYFLPNSEIKTGGMFRMKQRSNMFDMYSFKPNPGVQEYVPYETDFEDITWRVTGGAGTPSHVLNYDSYENIFAQYLQFKTPFRKFDFIGGLRVEHTTQGFMTADNLVEDGYQTYWSILPSFHLKHPVTDKSHIRASYYRSLSRPSFLEIVPYRRPSTEEIISRGGNSKLKPVDAHNFDVRYELFPNQQDQLLIGAFYKNIYNPIETAVLPPTDPSFPSHFPASTTLMPVNFEMAVNVGFEADFIKYFNRIGIRANYTYTNSEIESTKRTWAGITVDNYDQLTNLQKQTLNVGDSTFLNVIQIRPLQGQSKHLGNLSLLYKDQKNGIDMQLSAVYTGERIAVVSTGFETDWWQKSTIQLDFAADKKFGNRFTLFVKANNLLDTPLEMIIKRPYLPSSRIDELQPNGGKKTLVRKEFFSRNYQIGLRFNL